MARTRKAGSDRCEATAGRQATGTDAVPRKRHLRAMRRPNENDLHSHRLPAQRRKRSMNDDWIAQAVRAHVRDGSSQNELTRSELERRQQETVRRLEAAVTERKQKASAEADLDAD